IPETVVEAFLIVGEPVHDIRVLRSQAVLDTFRYSNTAIKDADVRLIVGDRELQLAYRDGGDVGEYYLPDTTYRIEPSTIYKLIVTTKDGAVLTGETKTPIQIEWIDAPVDTLWYPKDSLQLEAPDSLALSWTGAPGISEYLVSVKSLDTLGYGEYLKPSTQERNRRIERFFEEGAPDYDDVARINFVQATGVPLVWFAFKWFGRNEVKVFASDASFINWFKMVQWQNPATYQPLLGNVRGGLGVVASASVVSREVFVYKNQP
ncbi:MAG: DUF4249 family protein, partial [bacterium]|nr:DUF4249 family protein [Candidatus Kapabacteria bacterium]